MHKKKAGKLQTGITFPKQYWLAVNGKPKNGNSLFETVTDKTRIRHCLSDA